MAERLVMVCGKCGSPEVTCDALAEWDVAAQGWNLGAVCRQAFCHRCEAGTRIEEAPLAQARPTDP